MVKLFFITFFIAELIIAFSIIFKLYQWDKSVNRLNHLIAKNKIRIKFLFTDIRFVIEEFNKNFINLRILIKDRQQKYIMWVLKNTLIYSSVFLLRGKWRKYRKIILSYQIIKEFLEGFISAAKTA